MAIRSLSGPTLAVRPGAAAALPVRREVWVDTLRVVVIAGVIVAHVATAYIVPVDWYYQERTTSRLLATVLSLPVGLGGVFALGPLFLVAGWLSAWSLARRGRASFVRSRLIRLGVPFLVFVLIVDPITDYIGDLGEGLAGPFPAYFHPDSAGPMWFVAALLAFSLVYAALPRRRPPRASARWSPPVVFAAAAAAIALGSLAAWQLWPLAGESYMDLVLSEWPQGAVLFALGVYAAERGWLKHMAGALVRRLGWIAVTGLVALAALLSVWLAQGRVEELLSGLGWPTIALALLDGVIAVGGTMWLVTRLRDRWPTQGALLARAGRASYAAYFIHATVLTLLGTLMASVALAPELKFVIVAPVGVLACFVVGYALTRVPGVSKVL